MTAERASTSPLSKRCQLMYAQAVAEEEYDVVYTVTPSCYDSLSDHAEIGKGMHRSLAFPFLPAQLSFPILYYTAYSPSLRPFLSAPILPQPERVVKKWLTQRSCQKMPSPNTTTHSRPVPFATELASSTPIQRARSAGVEYSSRIMT